MLSLVFHRTNIPVVPKAHRPWQELAGSGFVLATNPTVVRKPAEELEARAPSGFDPAL